MFILYLHENYRKHTVLLCYTIYLSLFILLGLFYIRFCFHFRTVGQWRSQHGETSHRGKSLFGHCYNCTLLWWVASRASKGWGIFSLYYPQWPFSMFTECKGSGAATDLHKFICRSACSTCMQLSPYNWELLFLQSFQPHWDSGSNLHRLYADLQIKCWGMCVVMIHCLCTCSVHNMNIWKESWNCWFMHACIYQARHDVKSMFTFQHGSFLCPTNIFFFYKIFQSHNIQYQGACDLQISHELN